MKTNSSNAVLGCFLLLWLLQGCAGKSVDPSCGDGVANPGETCGEPSLPACPSDCDDSNPCTVDTLEGSALTCNAACSSESITACSSGDGCCPAGCVHDNDSDCSALCGNGVADPKETCGEPSLPACPSNCDDQNPCTVDTLTGSTSNCNAVCSHAIINSCLNGDGCCPANCNSGNDNDCSAFCGNGVADPNETCGEPSLPACPASCNDQNPCTTDTLMGSASNCNAACSHTDINSCLNDDGCCPANCNSGNDSDCPAFCGNGVADPNETCGEPSLPACPASCNDQNPCTSDSGSGSAQQCNKICIHDPIDACASGDGCCPAGCNHGSDSDCAATENCEDWIDNNGNGLYDCEDPECEADPYCTQYWANCDTMSSTPITVNVYVIVYDQIIESEGNRKITEIFGWQDPIGLSKAMVRAINKSSCGFVNYQIVGIRENDYYPPKIDGFAYDDTTFMACLRNYNLCHSPDESNVANIAAYNDYAGLVANQGVREFWVWAAPYIGFDEYAMKIPNDQPYGNPNCLHNEAYWFYRPKTLPDLGVTYWMMGLNFERREGEMLESYGHRVEGILSIAIASCEWQATGTDPWSKFTWIEKNMPNQSQCGGIHYTPNSLSDYEWNATRMVNSACGDYYTYPTLPGQYASINCSAWNCDNRGGGRDYKVWWMSHLPHSEGTTDGKQNNWWKYIVDYDNAF